MKPRLCSRCFTSDEFKIWCFPGSLISSPPKTTLQGGYTNDCFLADGTLQMMDDEDCTLEDARAKTGRKENWYRARKIEGDRIYCINMSMWSLKIDISCIGKKILKHMMRLCTLHVLKRFVYFLMAKKDGEKPPVFWAIPIPGACKPSGVYHLGDQLCRADWFGIETCGQSHPRSAWKDQCPDEGSHKCWGGFWSEGKLGYFLSKVFFLKVLGKKRSDTRKPFCDTRHLETVTPFFLHVKALKGISISRCRVRKVASICQQLSVIFAVE